MASEKTEDKQSSRSVKYFSVIIALFGTFTISLLTMAAVIKPPSNSEANEGEEDQRSDELFRNGMMFSSLMIIIILLVLGRLYNESEMFKEDEKEPEDKAALFEKDSKDDAHLLAA
ncbi:unnamed protein product [Trichobilharzia regenti]|nr:unnamed protein product [Trichobilharzia regenti]